nr:MAG TPA: hypothetical protein [Caudoviricetes sp.]
MELVEDDTGDVGAVLGIDPRGQDLVEAVGGLVDDALLAGEDLDSLG